MLMCHANVRWSEENRLETGLKNRTRSSYWLPENRKTRAESWQQVWLDSLATHLHTPLPVAFIWFGNIDLPGDEDGLKTTAIEVTYVKVKRCPGCHYPLEKNGGCSQMACSQCSKSFCWVCLKDWSEHVYGQWFGCNERPEEVGIFAPLNSLQLN